MVTLDPHLARKRAKQEFEAWAHRYDQSLLNHFLFEPSYINFMEEIARWYSVNQRPFDLLDVGCGTGSLAALVAASNLPVHRLVGLDYAMSMCQQANRKASSAQSHDFMGFVHGDSEHLPFVDQSFDLLTCSNSFHHYPHQQNVVLEMKRVLRPGGQLMIIDGFRDNVIGWVVFDVIITAIEKSVHHAPWNTMRGFFEHASFGNITQRTFNFLFPSLLTIGTV